MVQWLTFHAPNTGGTELTPGQGARFHMVQLQLKSGIAKGKNK